MVQFQLLCATIAKTLALDVVSEKQCGPSIGVNSHNAFGHNTLRFLLGRSLRLELDPTQPDPRYVAAGLEARVELGPVDVAIVNPLDLIEQMTHCSAEQEADVRSGNKSIFEPSCGRSPIYCQCFGSHGT